MIAGHFGFAALVKSRSPATPLWALMLATVWLDIVFVPLLLMGIETIQPINGMHARYGEVIIHADYTHSLVGALALSAILGAAAWHRWDRQSGIVVGFVSFSHWILDLFVHRGDLPLLPGNLGDLPRLGFGLWRFSVASAVVELALVAIGAWFYWRAARVVALEAKQSQALATTCAVMVLAFGVLILALDVTSLTG